MRRPLEGLRVVDIGISTAGPYAARLLGDLGAEVVKVEPLDGENTRSLGQQYGRTGYLYHVNNYNKRSVTLKVQHPRGRDLFLELVAKSDVVIENFAIGTMDRWGIGYEACRRTNPAVVYVSVKGFGESGPMRFRRAFDTVTQALSGLMDATGEAGSPPLKAGPSVCDLLGAAVSSMAAAAALVARDGRDGRLIDTALFDMGAFATLPLWPLARDPDAPAAVHSLGNGHPLHAPFGDYACADGRVMVAVTRDAQWRPLAGWLDRPAAWDCATRVAHRADIDDALSSWLGAQRAAQAVERLQSGGVPAAPVLDLAQVSTSPLLARRAMVHEVEHPAYGRLPLIDTPLAIAGRARSGPYRFQPTLGQDNEEILGDLLGHRAELAELRAAGVIA